MFGRYKYYIDIKMPALKSYLLRENEDEKSKRQRKRGRERSSDEFWS